MEEMEQIELARNTNGLKYQIYFISATYAIAAFVLWFLLWKVSRLSIDGITPFPFIIDTLIMFLILGFLLIILILFLQKSWQRERYFLRGGLLIVLTKNPFTGMTNEDVYRLDTVVTTNVQQSSFGKSKGYGNILLSIPKLHGNDVLVLKDINEPKKEVLKLHSKINSQNPSSGMAITN